MDVEYMRKLFKDDPEEFEIYTRKLIEETIDGFKSEERILAAKQLQWNIDNTLRKYKDPVARMNKMVELMWPSLISLNSELCKLTGTKPHVAEKKSADEEKKPTSADVIEFKPPEK